MVRWVNDDSLEEILGKPGIVAVAFIDETEKISQLFLSQFKEVETTFGDVLRFYAISALEHPSQKKEYNLSSIPATILFRDGRIVEKYEAAHSAKVLYERIRHAMKAK